MLQPTYGVQASVGPELIDAVLEPPGIEVSRRRDIDIMLEIVAIVFFGRTSGFFWGLVVPVTGSHKIEWNTE